MAAAVVTAASGSSAAAAPPRPVPEECKHKNRLQEYAQRSNIPMPIYCTVNEGRQHAPQFRSTVRVDGETFTSVNTFSRRKEAEQDVAKLAFESIMRKVKAEGVPQIDQDIVFCKSILFEYAVKLNIDRPSYSSSQSQGPLPTFVASVLFDRKTYTGDVATNKKDAEQKAARAAIKSILANSPTSSLMSEIIKSKQRLFSAITSSGCNKESAIVIQEVQPTSGHVFPSTAYPAHSLPSVALMHSLPPEAERSNEQVKLELGSEAIESTPAPMHSQGPSGTAFETLPGPSCANTVQGQVSLVAPPAKSVVNKNSKKHKKKWNKESAIVIQEVQPTSGHVLPSTAYPAHSLPPVAPMHSLPPEAERSNEQVKLEPGSEAIESTPAPMYSQGQSGTTFETLPGPSCANTVQGQVSLVAPPAESVVNKNSKKRKKKRNRGQPSKEARTT